MPAVQINFSMDSQLKLQADAVCSKIGLTLTDALRMFLRQMVAIQGLPLATHIQDLPPDLPLLKLTPAGSKKFWELIDNGDPQTEDRVLRLLQDYKKLNIRSEGLTQ